MTMVDTDPRQRVTVGVDTHADTHVACAVDGLGNRLGHASFPADEAGYRQLAEWSAGHGTEARFGVEGTGSYGAGLARHLRQAGLEVIEVGRPDRRTRRDRGKSDTVDAEAAARAVLAGTATAAPKARDGDVEAIRALRVARNGAVRARTAAANQLHGLAVTAPGRLRRQLAGTALARAKTASRFRPANTADPVETAVKQAMRSIARRYLELTAEIAELDAALGPLVAAAAPNLIALPGIGTDCAGQLLVTAGDNHHRITSEAAFARICGTSPLPASSGKRTRHRLNRGGDRQANAALHRIAINRLRIHQPTRDYLARRQTEGKTKPEIIRCLKRYIARQIYNELQQLPLDSL